jgi:hypothetical protein
MGFRPHDPRDHLAEGGPAPASRPIGFQRESSEGFPHIMPGWSARPKSL